MELLLLLLLAGYAFSSRVGAWLLLVLAGGVMIMTVAFYDAGGHLPLVAPLMGMFFALRRLRR